MSDPGIGDDNVERTMFGLDGRDHRIHVGRAGDVEAVEFSAAADLPDLRCDGLALIFQHIRDDDMIAGAGERKGCGAANADTGAGYQNDTLGHQAQLRNRDQHSAGRARAVIECSLCNTAAVLGKSSSGRLRPALIAIVMQEACRTERAGIVSDHDVAAVGIERCAGVVGPLVGRQQDGRRGDFLDISETPQRQLCAFAGTPFLRQRRR